ncbi:MAG: hypothetical protein K9K37_04600 [Desulfocapsa sp.]|nr:hypothetical protein [Desulfocapsa sp.]
MFSEMVAAIRQGNLPDSAPLRGRFRAALTKKLALVSQPPTYWESDPKRNPDTEHLLWAVLLLHDLDLFEVVKGIILMEQAEREGLTAEQFLDRAFVALLRLAPDEQFQAVLRKRVSWYYDFDTNV